MRIVLDANAICHRDWLLSGPSFALLERAVQQGEISLFVPEIVVEEVKNKHREHLEKRSEEFQGSGRDINQLLEAADRFQLPVIDIDAAQSSYERRLDQRLRELGAQRPGYAEIPHQRLVERDLSRKRPFQESGRGYRDALLWETLITTIANPETTTILVTANWRDFCGEKGGGLHPDLLADLASHELAENAVTVLMTVDALADRHIKPLFPSNAAVLRAIMGGQFEQFGVKEFFDQHREEIRQELQSQLRSGKSAVLPGEVLDDIDIPYLEDPSEFEITDAREIDENHLYVEFFCISECLVDFFVSKPDYLWMAEQYDFSVADSNWNEYVVRAQKHLSIPFRTSVIMAVNDFRAEGFEVALEEQYGTCQLCGSPILSDAAEVCPKCGARLF